MGCEFSKKVNSGTPEREAVQEVYDKLPDDYKSKFDRLYGKPCNMDIKETWRAYYHCKKFIKTKNRVNNKFNTDACCDSPGHKKCDQCQETGTAHPHNH